MTLKTLLPETVKAGRLTLRRPVTADIADLMALANNANVVAHTATLPHPYRREDGEEFIATLDREETPRSYAIAGADDRLMGVMLLKLPQGDLPELGYWLGEPHWGKGYATEAATALLGTLKAIAPRVSAQALAANAASVRVLEKAGFAVAGRATSTLARHAGKSIVIMEWVAP